MENRKRKYLSVVLAMGMMTASTHVAVAQSVVKTPEKQATEMTAGSPTQEKRAYEAPKGKEIYIPKDLRDNDFTDPESQWSFARMEATENVVCFWEKPFGDRPETAPDLDGHNMKVDMQNLMARLEYYYQYYRDQLKFTLPGSNADKYRMMVMLNYSLEGTAYGGDYDGVIGALWIAPNRVQDKKLNCIAHELGHSFQSQVGCDGAGHSWGGGGIFEMTSQWMLWQTNPEWTTDENYHWTAFCDLFHKRFLDGENIYHSPYVLEYWSMKHGLTVMGRLFREGQQGEDPLSTYMRIYNVSLEEEADEMYDNYSRLLTFDFPRVKESHKKYACQLSTPMVHSAKVTLPNGVTLKASKGGEVLVPTPKKNPCTFGFNSVELPISKGKHTVQFQGGDDPQANGYRYGIVLVDQHMDATYLPMQSAFKGKLEYTAAADTHKAYLVVVGYPKDKYEPYTFNPYDEEEKKVERDFDYAISVK